jgi:threonine/homoserine/homoserine lactone efflux protein
VTGSFVAFAVFAAVLTITPGLDTLLVLRASAAGGPRAGIGAAGGIVLGCLVWAAVSAAGMTAVLTASRAAFDVLRLAGAVYLCWLGVRALWTARRPPDPGAVTEPVGERWSVGRAMRTGLTTNLLNPKVGVFYLSVLPQFLPKGLPPLVGGMALAMVHVVEGLLWLSLLAFLVTRAGRWLTRPAVRRRFEQVTGVVLVGFGVRLALDHAP